MLVLDEAKSIAQLSLYGLRSIQLVRRTPLPIQPGLTRALRDSYVVGRQHPIGQCIRSDTLSTVTADAITPRELEVDGALHALGRTDTAVRQQPISGNGICNKKRRISLSQELAEEIRGRMILHLTTTKIDRKETDKFCRNKNKRVLIYISNCRILYVATGS